MKIIGITGGVGSGKSQILAFLETEYEAKICQADHVAWHLQEQGTPCYKEMINIFGKEILKDDGNIDRSILGQIVFSDQTKLEQLNRILHPAVKAHIIERIQQETKKGTKLFVIEAALLIEEHYDEICDELWYIYTDEQIRRQRLKASREYTDEKIDAIMASQLSEEQYRKCCNVVLDNTGTFEQTCLQIRRVLKQ